MRFLRMAQNKTAGRSPPPGFTSDNPKSAGRPVAALPVHATFNPAAPRIGGSRRSLRRRRRRVVVIAGSRLIGVARARAVSRIRFVVIIGPVGGGDGRARDR